MPLSTRPLVIINSGSFAEPELSAEFGPLPPALLPVGLGRLYQLQADIFGPLDADLYLTLPSSFDLPGADSERLESLGVTVLRTPDDMELGSALLCALGQLGFSDRPLRLLHGDTLVGGIDVTADDVMAVSDGGDGYRWAHVDVLADEQIGEISEPNASTKNNAKRLCGYFAFSSTRKFAEDLAISAGNFYEALRRQASSTLIRGVQPDRWSDFGHLQTFFQSRRIVTTQRAFNSLRISETSVRKWSGVAANKLRAESRWLEEAPSSMVPFCARVLSKGEEGEQFFYETEYEYMPTLSELHVFGQLNRESWKRIFDSCKDFLNASVDAAPNVGPTGAMHRLCVEKAWSRLEMFAVQADIDLDEATSLNGRPAPSLRQCMNNVAAVLDFHEDRPSAMHGDFCFSNILYNSRTSRIRVIDPRAVDEAGVYSREGDLHYDLAKFMHSVAGRYDLIMAGRCASRRYDSRRYELTFPSDAEQAVAESMANTFEVAGVRLRSSAVWAAMISLFLSMPPLHADRPDRQAAFIANALRLHSELEKIA